MFALWIAIIAAFAHASTTLSQDVICAKCHDLFLRYKTKAVQLTLIEDSALRSEGGQTLKSEMLSEISQECSSANIDCRKPLHTLRSYHGDSVSGFLSGNSWFGDISAPNFCANYVEACEVKTSEAFMVTNWLRDLSKSAVDFEVKLAHGSSHQFRAREDDPCASVCSDDHAESSSCFQCCTTVKHERDWGCDNLLTAPACCFEGNWTSACYSEATKANNQHACNECTCMSDYCDCFQGSYAECCHSLPPGDCLSSFYCRLNYNGYCEDSASETPVASASVLYGPHVLIFATTVFATLFSIAEA